MSQQETRPVIVKRVKRVEAGHHGGAWKVAYADFVTAMMAFFLLMWLLSSTTDEQRQGIADYFSPNMALPSSARGGDGPFAGQSMFSADPRIDAGEPGLGNLDSIDSEPVFDEIEAALAGSSGDAAEADPLLRHVRTRLTDEGLIIEVFDIEGSPLFAQDAAEPEQVLGLLVAMIGRAVTRAANPIAVTGHLGRPLGAVDPFELSAARAQVVRRLLEDAGVMPSRLARVTGKADREPAGETLLDPRNRRVEITLLRRFAP